MSKEATPAKPVKGDSTPGSPTTNAIDITVPKDVDSIRGPGSLGAKEALGLDEDPRDILESIRNRGSTETSSSATVPATKRQPKPKKKDDNDDTSGSGSDAGSNAGGQDDGAAGSGEPAGGQDGVSGGDGGAGTGGDKQDGSGTPEGAAGEGQTPPEGGAGDAAGQDDGAPATPPAEQKVKIGVREYTTTELENLLKQRQEQQQQQPVKPEAPAPKEPTEEEKAAAAAEAANKERTFIEDTAKKITFATISEADMDAILEGGEPAAAKMSELLAKQAAHTILETRKGVYDDVNSYIRSLEERLGPVFAQQDQLQRVAVETQFLQTYPEYAGNEQALKAARQVAEQLVTQYPEETSKMGLPDFIAEVDRQTSEWLNGQIKMWNPQFQGSWRDFQSGAPAAPAAAPAAPAGPTPAAPPAPAPAAAPAPAGTPAAPTARQVQQQPKKPRPPAANTPASSGSVDPNAVDWQKTTAHSLRD